MNGKRTTARSPERLGRPLSNPCTKLLTTPAEHEEAQQPQIKAILVNPIQPASPAPSPFASKATSQSPADLLNADITYQDVEAALKRLKRHKAAGVDGIKAEFILEASAILMTPLVRTFNQILTQGVPPCWCIGLIHPIYKAGDKDDPGNYRGITVVVILAKLYAMVLEARAAAWAEQMKCRAEGQAGFRKDPDYGSDAGATSKAEFLLLFCGLQEGF